MKVVILVHPIFAPSLSQAKRNVDSILSLDTYLRSNVSSEVICKLLIGGWAASDELWEIILGAVDKTINKTTPKRFYKNYGKAFVVNSLYFDNWDITHNADAVMSIDSDILFDSAEAFMFERLFVAAESMEQVKCLPWGLVALNQKVANAHLMSCYENRYDYVAILGEKKFEEVIVWPSEPSGIAGGCLFINSKYWDLVGGYDVEKSKVYGPDDAFILLNTKRLGFSYQLIDSLAVVHPSDNDKDYAIWKKLVCHRGGAGSHLRHEDCIDEAEKFWVSRNAEVHGCLDKFSGRTLFGWARYVNVETIVSLEILLNDQLIGVVQANQYRKDLHSLFGQHCAFYYVLPDDIRYSNGDFFRIRVMDTNVDIENSPFLVDS